MDPGRGVGADEIGVDPRRLDRLRRGGHELGLGLVQVVAAERNRETAPYRDVRVLQAAPGIPEDRGRLVERLHRGDQLVHGRRGLQALLGVEILPVHVGAEPDAHGDGDDRPVALEAPVGAGRAEVLPVVVGRGQVRVLEVLVQGLVPAHLGEEELLDVHRARERVDAGGLGVQLDGHLLAQLLLGDDLVLDLDARQLREVGDQLLQHRVVGRQRGENDQGLALLLHPVEARRVGAAGGDDRAGGEPQAHPQNLSARERVCVRSHE